MENKTAEEYYNENIDSTNIPRDHYEYEIIQLMKDFGYEYATTQTNEILKAIEDERGKMHINIKPNFRNTDLQHGENTIAELAVILLDELLTKFKTD